MSLVPSLFAPRTNAVSYAKFAERTAIVVALLVCAAAVACAQSHSTAIVGQYHARQDLARGMTEQLLARIIDDQLQQMRDNHLTDMPLYEALVGMRGRIVTIAGVHMPEVLELLDKAATAGDDQRIELIRAAQGHMQSILKRLIAERELVRARNQQAALIQRMGEIIAGQKNAWRQTRDANDANEQQVIAAADAQATTRLLFHEFDQTLSQVSGWPGDLGSVASEAKRILVTSRLAGKLDEAVARIEQLELPKASALQQEILADLERIEIEIHKLEDPAWIGDDLARALKELIDQQEQLRAETRDLTAGSAFMLLEQQSLVQEKLGRLVAKVGSNERAIMLAIRAETSAADARQAIFDNDVPVSVDHQGNVIGALVELQTELKLRDGMFDGPRSAAEFFALAQQMQTMQTLLLKARETHGKALDRFAESPGESKAAVADTVSLLGTLELSRSTPPAVTRRIETARSFLTDMTMGKVATSRESLRFADHLIRFAMGEVVQAHRDAARNARAVKIGELNRAAESLSRAIGALRDESYLMRTGTERWGTSTPEEQATITATISEEVAEGTRELAPKAAPAIQSAILEIRRAVELAVHAGVNAENDGDTALAEQFNRSASALLPATDELRTEMILTARELESTVVAELEQLIALQAELDTLAGQSQLPESAVLARRGDVVMQQYAAIGAALHAAAATRENDPKQPSREIERARVLADIRRQELEELLEMIRELLKQIEQQQDAAEILIEARDEMESENGEQVDPSELASAYKDFAESLTEIGQTAEAVTQQPELANEPIREAAELAATLTPQVPGEEPPEQDPSQGDPQASPADIGEYQPGEFPTGMTPGDPMSSARLLSGTEASAKAEETLAQTAGGTAAQTAGGAAKTGVSMGSLLVGDPATNAPKPPSATSMHDPEVRTNRDTGRRPWTASLPDEIRASMRSSSKSELPKHYENQLKAYFQAFD